jgi:hypothetical protein
VSLPFGCLVMETLAEHTIGVSRIRRENRPIKEKSEGIFVKYVGMSSLQADHGFHGVHGADKTKGSVAGCCKSALAFRDYQP